MVICILEILESMTPKINKENAHLILNWCFERLGKSRFNGSKPKLIVHNKMSKEDLYGYYTFEKNVINVYIPKQNGNIIDYIDTIIHEFWHYKQNVKKMYHKYVFKYGYDYNENHPYERTARKKARQLRHKCYDELFK